MKERVKNLSTPARRPATAADALDAHAQAHASGHHVTFAPGVGGTPRAAVRPPCRTPPPPASPSRAPRPPSPPVRLPPPPPPSATRVSTRCWRSTSEARASPLLTFAPSASPASPRSARTPTPRSSGASSSRRRRWRSVTRPTPDKPPPVATASPCFVSLNTPRARFLRFLVTRRTRSRGITSGSTSAWRGSRWCPTWTTRGTRSSTSSRRGSGSSTPCSGPSGPRLGFSTRGRRRR